MASYVCVSLSSSNQCLEWAQMWSIAALSVDDAAIIATKIVACWAVAYGVRLIAHYIITSR